MEKKSIADKLAEKTFNSAKFQQSWMIHMQAFGSILEPAFAEDFQSRVHLAAALNKISGRDIKGGLDKLKPLQNACQNDADKAAWCFFVGLCYEMAGAKDQMVQLYQQAGQYGHRFYLPYLKVAKAAHNDGVFEIAEENYLDAIACFDGKELDGQSKTILASVYTNLASSLTMMHRYEDAEKALETSVEFLPKQQGRAATQAILSAAQGDGDKVTEYLNELKTDVPAMVESTQKMTDEILRGEHAHFSELNVDAERINAFWDWFAANEQTLIGKIREKEYGAVFEPLQRQLAEVFPFMQRELDCGFMPSDDGIELTFADFFVISLQKGYEKLIAACPEELRSRWSFSIEH